MYGEASCHSLSIVFQSKQHKEQELNRLREQHKSGMIDGFGRMYIPDYYAKMLSPGQCALFNLNLQMLVFRLFPINIHHGSLNHLNRFSVLLVNLLGIGFSLSHLRVSTAQNICWIQKVFVLNWNYSVWHQLFICKLIHWDLYFCLNFIFPVNEMLFWPHLQIHTSTALLF